MLSVDLNCDMGEGFGNYACGHDADLLAIVTSANVACGFHAGDPATMRKTVQMALANKVAIGAHPGLPDLLGFGRRNMDIAPADVIDLVVYQVSAILGFVRAEGGVLRHVKPHGALYNMAVKNSALARAIAEGVAQVDPGLILFGLAGSVMLEAAQAVGLRTAAEAFVDRSYQDDGSLTPRSTPGAMIDNASLASEQAVRLVSERKVRTLSGREIPVACDTLCIHGDESRAVEFARRVRTGLEQAGVDVKSL